MVYVKLLWLGGRHICNCKYVTRSTAHACAPRRYPACPLCAPLRVPCVNITFSMCGLVKLPLDSIVYAAVLHTQQYIHVHTCILGSLMVESRRWQDASPVMNAFTKPVKILVILCLKGESNFVCSECLNVSC